MVTIFLQSKNLLRFVINKLNNLQRRMEKIGE